MKDKLLNTAFKVRANVTRVVKPGKTYWLATRSIKPLSSKFGFDRGTPIDRFWIEKFIKENAKDIKGRVLEIGDNRYTKAYGKDVTKSEVLDVDSKNSKANIIADLRKMPKVPSNTYDCVIVTHVLGMVDEVDSAVSELHRILKPGGIILATSASLSPTYDLTNNYWRFTPAGFKYLFEKHFAKNNISCQSFGNVLTGQAFWAGLAQEDLTKKELEFDDPHYPCVVAIRAKKSK